MWSVIGVYKDRSRAGKRMSCKMFDFRVVLFWPILFVGGQFQIAGLEGFENLILPYPLAYANNGDEFRGCLNPEDSWCGLNERWFKTRPPCLASCDTFDYACLKNKTSGPGCDCRSGFARSLKSGVCVPYQQCLKERCSGPKEIWQYCGQAYYCEPTCGRLDEPCNIQTLVCPEGCQCEPGLVRDPLTNDCVRIDECPGSKKCGVNEHFEKCGNRCLENCSSNNSTCQTCENGCFCNKNFVRLNGRCVPKEVCECKSDEVYSLCGNSCNEDCPGSGRVCPQVCQKGCFCPKNHVRKNGKCVSKSACNCTKPNEVYYTCGSPCHEKCPRTGHSCPQVCEVGCFCAKDFSRINGTCTSNQFCKY